MTSPALARALRNPEAIQQVFEAVAKVLLEKQRVEVHGFGAFEVQVRKSRRSRNPRTGERMELSAKMVVKFKPASALQEQVEALPLPPGV